MSARLVVLISGSGSNLQAILDACQAPASPSVGVDLRVDPDRTHRCAPTTQQGRLPAEVVAVFSNKKDAFGLERARRSGVPAIAVPKPRELDRRVYDAALAEQVLAYGPDWVILAGWMRILSAEFLKHFPNRVINLHPALPGTFPGTDAIQRAYAAYQQGAIAHTGVMVHLVPDEGVDCGPVLAQEIVPILPGEALEELEARVHGVEHCLLVTVLEQILEEKA